MHMGGTYRSSVFYCTNKLNTLTLLFFGCGFLLFYLHSRHIINTICTFTCSHCQQVSVSRMKTFSVAALKMSCIFFVSVENLNTQASDSLFGLKFYLQNRQASFNLSFSESFPLCPLSLYGRSMKILLISYPRRRVEYILNT